MRTGPAVAATISQWYPDFPVSVHLFDANPERLELIDLLTRQLMDQWNSEVQVMSSGVWSEIAEGTTDLVITLHEDCARRMEGGGQSESLEYFENAAPMDFYLGGDRNKPTPVDQLSEQTKSLLTVPESSDERETVLRRVAQNVLEKSSGVRAVNLMRGVELMGSDLVGIDRLEWPEAVDEGKLVLVPHQILRWVRGDDLMGDLRTIGMESPLRAWLVESENE